MAENTKKFLDFTGLQKYDELLKKKVAADIKVVKDDLDTRLIKDTANSDTITWTKENGTYTASVKGVVLDNADYSTVKNNATQSAAAWTKFLEGSTGAYPNGITPALKDLATKSDTSDALDAAKKYADGLVKDAEGNVKFDTKGSAAQALIDAKAYTDGKIGDIGDKTVSAYADSVAATAKSEAIQAAKDYADGAFDTKGSAATAETNAKAYADGLAKNYDAAGAAAQALADAKSYADGKASTAESNAKSYADGVAATAKTEAISEAKTYTNGEIQKVNDAISSINTSIAGGVHFRGVVDPLPVSPFTGYVNGDIIIVGQKEYILNKPTEGDGEWVELGDTTAESQRITNLEGHVSTLMGADTVEGSVAKALKDANIYTDGKITELTSATGQVGKNKAAIAVLNGDETTAGSVAKALKDAKDYTDTAKKAATDYTDSEILELVGESGQVGKNTAAITKLNADSSTLGSVDYKIAQAVSTIEASIDTISEADITGLFSK